MGTHRRARRAVGALLLAAALSSPAIAHAQVTITDPNFVFEQIYSGNGMVTMTWGPGNRLYVCEKRGRVLVMEPNGTGGYNPPVVFVDLVAEVVADQESGLLGLVLDPDFAANRNLFVFYSTATDQRIVRFTADASYNQASGAGTVILSGLPRMVGTHKAGDIKFHPTDPNNLYVVLGDDARPNDVDDTAVYHGKILKISKVDGTGLMSNPFWNGNATSVQSRIWARGFRNPFRFTFHPNTPQPNVLYVSENGNMTDRVARVEMGGDGAWNSTGDSGGFLNPPDARVRVLRSDTPFNVGIVIARGGPFADPANPNDDVLLLSNGAIPTFQGSVRRWRLSGANFDTLTAIAADGGQPFINRTFGMDMKIGPDGALYMTKTVTFEADSSSMQHPFALNRVRRVGGAPPVASFMMSPSPARGPAPLNVTFTDASSDSDGTISSWSWSFGDGATSTMRNPTHSFQNPGTYTVTLTVTDNTALQTSVQQTVTAVAAANISLRGNIFDGRNLMNQGLQTAVQLRLYQADGTTPISFTGGLGPNNNGVQVPAGGAINSDVTIELTGTALVISAGEGTAPFEPAQAGFSVPAAGGSVTLNLAFHLSDTAMRGRVRDTRGTAARVDIGASRGAEGTLYAVAGGRDYLAASGIPPSGVNHRIVSDDFGFYYLPVRTGDAPAMFFFGAVADTGRATYVPTAFSVMIGNGALVNRDITVGLQAGGMGCDDLSGIAQVPMIDYTTQIQPIWNASCTGCHSTTGSANGGLGLEGATESYAALVGVQSREVPGRRLVDPGNTGASFLLEKLNCANPQVGTQMRPMDRLPLAEQALVRDWIAQGAVFEPGQPPVDAGPLPDLGPPPPMDANVPPLPDAMGGGDDAGPIVVADATDPGTDAGRRPSARGSASGSCGCSSAAPSDLSISALVLLALLARRRRPC